MNRLRWLISGTVCAALLGAAGCAKTKSSASSPGGTKAASRISDKPAAASKKDKVIVTPLPALGGKVSSVDAAGQYVILTFQGGTVPPADQKLNVYRDGLKVGEVQIGRQQMGQNVVADIVAGEAKINDTARGE